MNELGVRIPSFPIGNVAKWYTQKTENLSSINKYLSIFYMGDGVVVTCKKIKALVSF